MNRVLLGLVVALTGAANLFAQVGKVNGNKFGWLNDFEAAKAEAKPEVEAAPKSEEPRVGTEGQ